MPLRITNGSPCIFTVMTAIPFTSLDGTLIGREIHFFHAQQKNTWYGLAGVDVETPSGSYALNLTGTTKSGEKLVIQRAVMIGKTIYPKVTLHVPEQFVAPSPEQQQQIDEDKALNLPPLRRATFCRNGRDFSMPVQADASDSFGTARIFNGKVASVHRGTDFRVISGTPVRAANDGRVVLASPLFFEGNCVVIDHGEGLKTIYVHLSEIQVKSRRSREEGPGNRISGGTGRRLDHISILRRDGRVLLDPTELLKLKMPEYHGE